MILSSFGSENVSMGDMAASVDVVGWAFAAMCDHTKLCIFIPLKVYLPDVGL